MWLQIYSAHSLRSCMKCCMLQSDWSLNRDKPDVHYSPEPPLSLHIGGDNLRLAGFYLHRAQQGVFPTPLEFTEKLTWHNSHISIIWFCNNCCPWSLLFMWSKMLLRWVSVNPNMKLWLSFQRFAREGANPRHPLWATKVVHYPSFTPVSPAKKFWTK